MNAYDQFQEQIARLNDLMVAISALTWDARTHMPPGGSATRSHQLATLSELTHQLFTSDEIGRLLERAEKEIISDDPDSYRVRAVRQPRQAYDLTRRIPVSLIREHAELKSTAQQVWADAREANDFSRFAPYLERMVRITRELASIIGYEEHIYDALLLQYEPGMTTTRLRALLAELKESILPLLRRITEEGKPTRSDFLHQDYPEDLQRAFALEIAQAFGYDLNRGRLDRSAHPFEISFTREDVRITTRYNRRYLPTAMFGVFHEAGHALYEQNVDPSLTRTALATDFLGLYAVGGASYGMHEAQSRLWENLVGRSKNFWRRHLGRLQQFFPEQLSGVDTETFYRAVNQVQPSPIRVEADEVTYNLHIMVRVEIELALMEDKLQVSDLPEAWNAKMEEYLGIRPPSDSVGVLQDIHWSAGLIGSFPTYTLGNLMGAQLFRAAHRDIAGLDESLLDGDYTPLLRWLTDNVYRHGRAYTPEELIRRATGNGLETQPYLEYLWSKYQDVYELR